MVIGYILFTQCDYNAVGHTLHIELVNNNVYCNDGGFVSFLANNDRRLDSILYSNLAYTSHMVHILIRLWVLHI